MADALASARTKLARGNLHKATARREAGRFFRGHPSPTFRVEPEGDEGFTHAGAGTTFGFRVVVDSAPPDLPASFAARFGDAIHNYRSALDHVAWQLVRHGSGWPLKDERAANAVQFPIYDTLGGFRYNQSRRLPGVDQDAMAFIQARHGYVRGNATNNELLALAKLSNDDKHRALHVFAGLFRFLKSNVTFTECLPVSWENPPERPALKPGAELVRGTAVVTGPNPKVDMELRPTVEIVVEDWGDFYGTLEVVSVEVAKVLDAPEIVTAVS